MTNRKIEYWVIPPESDSEFVASMEEVLDICATPYNPNCRVVRIGRAAARPIVQRNPDADFSYTPTR